MSTHDVAGQGQFTLFTGIGGADGWRGAAEAVMKSLSGVSVRVVSIGPGQDYSDTFYMWEDHRGVEESGAVLVRPDRTVAWRSRTYNGEQSIEKLHSVLKQVLYL